eukprot:TRINITY_DN2869_c0_g1_i4.p1 TRINITY_DN2869_c0_g1~~TRINITY_DN2869_c0_g1_i4.p1  ORF type:complete len:955 (-),score=326.09 TRINITY_DN2869_c0_g1_i4:43-2907(-)
MRHLFLLRIYIAGLQAVLVASLRLSDEAEAESVQEVASALNRGTSTSWRVAEGDGRLRLQRRSEGIEEENAIRRKLLELKKEEAVDEESLERLHVAKSREDAEGVSAASVGWAEAEPKEQQGADEESLLQGEGPGKAAVVKEPPTGKSLAQENADVGASAAGAAAAPSPKERQQHQRRQDKPTRKEAGEGWSYKQRAEEIQKLSLEHEHDMSRIAADVDKVNNQWARLKSAEPSAAGEKLSLEEESGSSLRGARRDSEEALPAEETPPTAAAAPSRPLRQEQRNQEQGETPYVDDVEGAADGDPIIVAAIMDARQREAAASANKKKAEIEEDEYKSAEEKAEALLQTASQTRMKAEELLAKQEGELQAANKKVDALAADESTANSSIAVAAIAVQKRFAEEVRKTAEVAHKRARDVLAERMAAEKAAMVEIQQVKQAIERDELVEQQANKEALAASRAEKGARAAAKKKHHLLDRLQASHCSGWSPPGDTKGSYCAKWNAKIDWCYVDENYSGLGKDFVEPSSHYNGKFFAPCGRSLGSAANRKSRVSAGSATAKTAPPSLLDGLRSAGAEGESSRTAASNEQDFAIAAQRAQEAAAAKQRAKEEVTRRWEELRRSDGQAKYGAAMAYASAQETLEQRTTDEEMAHAALQNAKRKLIGPHPSAFMEEAAAAKSFSYGNQAQPGAAAARLPRLPGAPSPGTFNEDVASWQSVPADASSGQFGAFMAAAGGQFAAPQLTDPRLFAVPAAVPAAETASRQPPAATLLSANSQADTSMNLQAAEGNVPAPASSNAEGAANVPTAPVPTNGAPAPPPPPAPSQATPCMADALAAANKATEAAATQTTTTAAAAAAAAEAPVPPAPAAAATNTTTTAPTTTPAAATPVATTTTTAAVNSLLSQSSQAELTMSSEQQAAEEKAMEAWAAMMKNGEGKSKQELRALADQYARAQEDAVRAMR